MDGFDEEKNDPFTKEYEKDQNVNFFTGEMDDFFDISELLKQQVNEEISAESAAAIISEPIGVRKRKGTPKGKLPFKLLKIFGITMTSFMLVVGFFAGTSGGRSIVYDVASRIILSYMHKGESVETIATITFEDVISNLLKIAREEQEGLNSGINVNVRKEKYVKNYLIFGIEEIGGARNTDSIMIGSINTKDNTIKLTSLLRDSYVEIPGWSANKLNSAYAKGGVSLLMQTIEQNYKIKLDGYAHVNFDSFEKIIDLLDGIDIELGASEANYLNTTNYISNPAYRNVKQGWNHFNGNQALGYCRVRKVVTLGGANNDYGRTVRQRRVINAIFEKCKSKGIFDLLSIVDDCLGLVTTNVSARDIKEAIEHFVEKGFTTMETTRIPVDGMFNDPYIYNGITYPIVLDWEANIKELYKFIYLDDDTEAENQLESLTEVGQ